MTGLRAGPRDSGRHVATGLRTPAPPRRIQSLIPVMTPFSRSHCGSRQDLGHCSTPGATSSSSEQIRYINLAVPIPGIFAAAVSDPRNRTQCYWYSRLRRPARPQRPGRTCLRLRLVIEDDPFDPKAPGQGGVLGLIGSSSASVGVPRPCRRVLRPGWYGARPAGARARARRCPCLPEPSHRCLSASRRLSGDRPGWFSTKARTHRSASLAQARTRADFRQRRRCSTWAGSPAAAMAARRSPTMTPITCSCSTPVTEAVSTRQPTTRKRFLDAAPTLARAGARLDSRLITISSGNGSRKQVRIQFDHSDPASDEEARWPSM